MTPPENIELISVRPELPLREVMEIMTTSPGTPMVVVVDENKKMLGVLVDYDIRKALLSGQTMDAPAGEIMNRNPIWMPDYTDDLTLYKYFQRRPLKAIPLLDAEHRFVRIAFISRYFTKPTSLPNWVVLMAGGQGTRLRPVTLHTPKPMVLVGDRPILETILRQFVMANFNKFMISVCYKSEQIMDYFGDGSQFDATIRYLQEDEPLGTAGALSLIEEEINHPLIVMNGDLLTRVNPKTLLDFHESSGHVATMCVRDHLMEVPYGVVKVRGTFLDSMMEKPLYRFMVNAGIYVLEPEVLQLLPKAGRMDMPGLLEMLKRDHGKLVGCFPVSEYWRDIGRPDEHSTAHQEYEQVFNGGCARPQGDVLAAEEEKWPDRPAMLT